MNRYQKVHDDANREIAEQRKRYEARNWYQNVYKFLDDDDVLTFNGTMRNHNAIRKTSAGIFQSRWNRKTKLRLVDDKPAEVSPSFGSDVERDAIVRLIEQALQQFEKRPIATTTQIETYFLERRAKQDGVRVDRYIADVLNISDREARRRLSTSRKVKTPLKSDSVDIIDIENKVRRQLPRLCAWCSEPTRDGLRTFCDKHHKMFLVDGDFETVLITDDEFWRLKNKSDAEHWQKAIQIIKKIA